MRAGRGATSTDCSERLRAKEHLNGRDQGFSRGGGRGGDDRTLGGTGRRDRGVKRARFMTVLREQNRPAVLIEGGFLSNSAEASAILRPEFREQMAQAVCSALPR